MGGADAYIDHSDVIGSTTMETDPAGGVQWKIAYYPWGQILAQGGVRQSVVWAGLDWQINDPSIPSATREYNDGLARWLTPDPGGVKVVKLNDPQTWNMYSYVGNNPTSRNDPSGECPWCVVIGLAVGDIGYHATEAYYDYKVFTSQGEEYRADTALLRFIALNPNSRAAMPVDVTDLQRRIPLEEAKINVTGAKLA